MAIFGGTGREREKRERGERGSTFSLRSMEIGRLFSNGKGFKVRVLNESYAWISETPSFAKVSHGRFEERKASGSGSVRGTSSGRCSCFKR